MNDIIRNLLEDMRYDPPPKTEYEAKERAYRDWACAELLLRITDHPFDDPEDIIEQFALEMLFYSRSKQSRMNKPNPFTVAYETAKHILLVTEHPKED